MPQLYGKLRFNGKLLDQYEIISTESSNERQFGLNVSIEREDGVGEVPLFVKRKKDVLSIPIQLLKCDNNGNLLKITDNDLFELSRLFYSKDDIGILECNGLVYYGHFVGNASEWHNSSRQGYVTLNYELSSPYCYSRVMLNSVYVKGEKTIEVFNKSNASECIFADLEVEMFGGNSIKLINMTTGKEFVIENLNDGEVFTIYSDSREVVSLIDSSRNLFKSCNRMFNALELKYGKNILKISSENARCKLTYQNEICLY